MVLFGQYCPARRVRFGNVGDINTLSQYFDDNALNCTNRTAGLCAPYCVIVTYWRSHKTTYFFLTALYVNTWVFPHDPWLRNITFYPFP